MICAEFGWQSRASRRWMVHAMALFFVLQIGGEEKSCDWAST
jgi:hypothetical protein